MEANKNIKIAIVTSDYHREITDMLLSNCLRTLKQNNINNITDKNIRVFNTPGALEIPLVCKKLARKNIYDAIIVFGVVLKGETYHFEQVSNECIRGCMNVSYQHEIPVIFEVLSVYDLQDAIKRATGKKDNRGVEGALSALKMIKLLASQGSTLQG